MAFFLIITVLLLCVNFYTIFSSFGYFEILSSLKVDVINVNITFYEYDAKITVMVFVDNPTSYDLTIEYLSVRPYLNSVPLIDPKRNPPFLGEEDLKGTLSNIPKFSNKTLSVSFKLPVESIKDLSEKSWYFVVTIIVNNAPLTGRIYMKHECEYAD